MIEIPRTIGLKKDDSNREVGMLQSYLQRFGYIIPDQRELFGVEVDRQRAIPAPERDVFDQNTEEALKRFQSFNKLPVTGVLDKRTLNLMSKPRCGVPDFTSRGRSSAGEVERFVSVGSKWDTMTVNYSMENFTPDLTQDTIKRAIRDALNQWSSVSPLRFGEVSSGGDLRISFASGDHGDGNPFDGPSGVLAHAYFPKDGRLHFDEAEIWTDNDPPSGIDLASVAVHELGHILGLDHSSETQAVMYAYYGGTRRSLHPDDIAGIQSIYGAVPRRETIRRGSRGDLVITLQKCLSQLGYDLGTAGVDGDFGPKTDAAVRKFQSDNGLEIDGIVGPHTWGAISAQCPEGP